MPAGPKSKVPSPPGAAAERSACGPYEACAKSQFIEVNMRTEFSRQCALQRGVETLVTWMPEEFAEVGKCLRLKQERQDEWSEGWTVTAVFNPRLPSDYVNERSRDYTKTRKATDI
jgi:hypothetical protein